MNYVLQSEQWRALEVGSEQLILRQLTRKRLPALRAYRQMHPELH